jgi:hypothetical protein
LFLMVHLVGTAWRALRIVGCSILWAVQMADFKISNVFWTEIMTAMENHIKRGHSNLQTLSRVRFFWGRFIRPRKFPVQPTSKELCRFGRNLNNLAKLGFSLVLRTRPWWFCCWWMMHDFVAKEKANESSGRRRTNVARSCKNKSGKRCHTSHAVSIASRTNKKSKASVGEDITSAEGLESGQTVMYVHFRSISFRLLWFNSGKNQFWIEKTILYFEANNYFCSMI